MVEDGEPPTHELAASQHPTATTEMKSFRQEALRYASQARSWTSVVVPFIYTGISNVDLVAGCSTAEG